VKRLIAASVALLVLVLGAGSATAASSGAGIEFLPVSFSLSSTSTNGVPGGCPFMPAGLTITWSGLEKSVTVVRTGADGLTTVQNTSHASGEATDQNGNTYAFNYSNEFRVTQTSVGSDLFSGTMTDHFSLAGNGLTLVNGFNSGLTTDLVDVFIFDNTNSRGDPIDFATVAPHCDPL
jgi:hypothetical protein